MFTFNAPPRAEARASLEVDPNTTLLLFFGIVRAYKGLRYVIQAQNLLKKAGYDTRLVIAGEFWVDKSEYLDLIHDLELGREITIDDRYVPNEDVGRYFSAADIALVPYVGGTQSGVAAIATTFNLSIIATQHIKSGILTDRPEMIHVVSAGSASAIAEAVERIILTPSMKTTATIDANRAWDELVARFSAREAKTIDIMTNSPLSDTTTVIVILAYNHVQDTLECINSLRTRIPPKA